MMTQLRNIASSVHWNKEGKIYYKTPDRKYELLIDYLNAIPENLIDAEIAKLQSFQKVLHSKNKSKIENYIVTELNGFVEYEPQQWYAPIAGFSDFSVVVLYDLSSNQIFLKHIYGEAGEKYISSISELIALLRESKSIKSSFSQESF